MQVQYEALEWDFFFDEPDIALSLPCCYFEENYKEKTNEIINLRERF